MTRIQNFVDSHYFTNPHKRHQKKGKKKKIKDVRERI